jgi:hypothetical protein
MGFMKNMFAKLEEEVGSSLSTSQSSSGGKATRRASGPPPTRWEKAVVSMDKIVVQVVKVDPDGVDIVCFGGEEDADWYRNIKKTKHIEEMVNDKRPSGVSHFKYIVVCVHFEILFVFLPSSTTRRRRLPILKSVTISSLINFKHSHTFLLSPP